MGETRGQDVRGRIKPGVRHIVELGVPTNLSTRFRVRGGVSLGDEVKEACLVGVARTCTSHCVFGILRQLTTTLPRLLVRRPTPDASASRKPINHTDSETSLDKFVSLAPIRKRSLSGVETLITRQGVWKSWNRYFVFCSRSASFLWV